MEGMDSYLDFGDSDSEEEGYNSDSSEETDIEKICIQHWKKQDICSKEEWAIKDFEQEMEAELDKRALKVEREGGVEHQQSLSRSSSSSSLSSMSHSGQNSASSSKELKPCLKRDKDGHKKSKKRISFDTKQEEEKAGSSSGSKVDVESDPKKYYDPIYFDSDESEGEDETKKSKKNNRRLVISNDDLFYDPSSDKRDQEWVDRQRTRYIRPPPPGHEDMSNANSSTSKSSPHDNSKDSHSSNLPKTDAILNCPACFSLLSLDCQRHEFYSGQYRAMFVQNCAIDDNQKLTIPEKKDKKFNKKKKTGEMSCPEPSSTAVKDTFHPVKCTVCNTQVALCDTDEVYHFFHVLASHP